jgi:hypothetical protein
MELTSGWRLATFLAEDNDWRMTIAISRERGGAKAPDHSERSNRSGKPLRHPKPEFLANGLAARVL